MLQLTGVSADDADLRAHSDPGRCGAPSLPGSLPGGIPSALFTQKLQNNTQGNKAPSPQMNYDKLWRENNGNLKNRESTHGLSGQKPWLAVIPLTQLCGCSPCSGKGHGRYWRSWQFAFLLFLYLEAIDILKICFYYFLIMPVWK